MLPVSARLFPLFHQVLNANTIERGTDRSRRGNNPQIVRIGDEYPIRSGANRCQRGRQRASIFAEPFLEVNG
jgi:hypothetical protein